MADLKAGESLTVTLQNPYPFPGYGVNNVLTVDMVRHSAATVESRACPLACTILHMLADAMEKAKPND